jgi:hypothetical protein
MRWSSGIAVAAIGLTATPAAAAPNKIPRTKLRRSIVVTGHFLQVLVLRLFDYSVERDLDAVALIALVVERAEQVSA